MGNNNEKVIETAPSAAPVINALRNIGYNAKTAISDLIDNSIDANANKINITFQYSLGDGFIRIEDNGFGMDENELQNAMVIGSKDPHDKRKELELGRFGMGLKTASFSLGKRLIVVTKKDGIENKRCWDLDFVNNSKKWLLQKEVFVDTKILGEIKGENGTIVYIDKLDRFSGANAESPLKEASYNQKIKKIKNYLNLVFYDLIRDGLEIYVNEMELKGWDPFLTDNSFTFEGEPQKLRFHNTLVRITPYILPHPSKFKNKQEYREAGGDKEWYGQQGFYVYREKRLVNYGHWFGLFTKDKTSELVRIKVEFSNQIDEDWKLDIKKSTITLPDALQGPLKAIAKNYRQQSRSIMLYRTTAAIGRSSIKGTLKTWELESDELDSKYILNRSHPFLLELLKAIDEDSRKLLNTYLKLVEMGSPANLLETENLVSEKEISENISEEIVSLIKKCAFILQSHDVNLESDNFIEAVIALANVENIRLETVKNIIGVD